MNGSRYEQNPKILHRIYFTNFAPFSDPFRHYLDSWHREMPGYTVMHWNMSNLNVYENAWTTKAFEQKAPVFLAEYFRWKILHEFGGLYLDADCEVINGKILGGIIQELYDQDEYDVFFGVEQRENGNPTAQTVGAKKGSDLTLYMMKMYEDSLAPLWSWRETRGLIGPQLMSLYFLDRNENVESGGFFRNLDEPVISNRVKIYPQTYFSPKFTILGEVLDFDAKKTCVYHLFANSNIDFSTSKEKAKAKTRTLALTFDEYRLALTQQTHFPKFYDASHLSTKVGKHTDSGIAATDANGTALFGPYTTLPPGDYVAKLVCHKFPTQGRGEFSITANAGTMGFGSKKIVFDSQRNGVLELPFSVSDAAAYDIEFVLNVDDIDVIEIEGVSVELQKKFANPMLAPGNLKILHRVYFGFDGKPDQFDTYLETWKEQLPDFQIMKWDASNLPMDINPYVRKLYQEKDHAFLTDFFRWYLLREYGGSYLDADVEVVNGKIYQTLIEELETSSDFDAFIGIDERKGGWYTAHSMASKPGSDLSKFMCQVYANFGSFAAWRKKGMYFWAPQLAALYFANMGHNVGGMGTTPNLDIPEVKARVKIYPQTWFSPLSPTGDPADPFALNGYSEDTSLCHHFACSWHDADSIYLEHSKKRGGQANVLLVDLIKSARNRNFSAELDSIQTQAGIKYKDAIISQGKSGCLVYGPHISLLAGSYSVTYIFRNIESFEGVVVDVVANFAAQTLAAKSLAAEDLQNDKVTLFFMIEKPHDAVEFRVHVEPDSAFELTSIKLKKLDSDEYDQ
jgi:mannosyltransferase OCH1-like enzyme